MLVVVVSSREQGLETFEQGLKQGQGIDLSLAQSGVAALQLIRSREPELVVVDNRLPDFAPLELVSEIIRARAFTQCAVVSTLSEDSFHEQSEGLGILAKLPDPPGQEDAEDLLNRMAALG